MNINYFLLCRDKYTEIINSIDNIIENIGNINNLTDMYIPADITNTNVMFSKPINNNIFFQQKLYALYLKSECLKYIDNLCKHEFIDDVIDIDPDRSKTICYCKHCDMSFENILSKKT